MRPTSASSNSSPQLIMVNVWTWAWVGCGTRPMRISSHCTWLAVSSRVSHTATGREASHSVCSNATTTYQPTSAPDSRCRPVRAAVRNSTPPRIAVHSPCPTGVNKPRRTSVSTSLDADRSQLLVTPPKAWQPLVQGEQAAHPAADRG